jgi:hypothetical protein
MENRYINQRPSTEQHKTRGISNDIYKEDMFYPQ